ncbi:MAG: trypsin-like peptidase domain-containing protein [Bacteroidota bacterium]
MPQGWNVVFRTCRLCAAILVGLGWAVSAVAEDHARDLDRVQALVEAERYDQALSLLRELDGKGGISSTDTALMLGRISLALGKPGKAAEFFEQVEFSSLDAEAPARLGLAESKLGLGDLAGARKVAEAVLKTDPDMVGAHLVLALVDQRLGRADAAFRRLQHLRTDRPDSEDVALVYARFLALSDGPAAALEDLRRFVAHHPRAAESWDRMGLYAWGLGRSAEAIEARKTARDLYAQQGRLGRVEAIQSWLAAIGPLDAPKAAEAPPPSPPPARPRVEAAPLPPPPPRPAPRVVQATVLASPEPLPFPPGSPIMTGSGIVLEGGRHIVTNRHVIDGQREIAVRNGAGHVRMARVIKTAPDDDLALLEIDSPFPDNPAFPLARLADPAPGRAAVVLGYPLIGILGDEQPALTEGIVARTAGIANDPKTFQMTAKINRGNSGGPVFDRQGRLIGIAVGKMDSADIVAKGGPPPEDINFAIKAGRLLAFLGAQPAKDEAGAEMGLEELYQQMLPRAVLVAGRK